MNSVVLPTEFRRRISQVSRAFLAAAGIGSLAIAARAFEPLQLQPYPQKVRTFYATNDAGLPAALQSSGTPLPVGGVTALAQASDHATWLGTTQGLMRLDTTGPAADRVQYLAGRRYLPDDQVLQLVPDSQAGVWVRTRTGAAHIELRPMTLAQKADLFEERIRARHDRYGLVADCALTRAGDVSSFRMTDNDNDGLWTSIYAAAECFRFAVTKSSAAAASARKAIEAMLFLEEVAGRRGFPARSYIRKGDPMPGGGEWHWTSDGQYYWKGDTSSDEIVGHFFIFGLAHDLLTDTELRQRIETTARRIMDHIIEHGYTLVDLDGKPTTWGWWSPDRLAKAPDERALNSMQLLSFLKTTAHITGDARYTAEYQKVATVMGYTNLITRVNEFRQEINYSDEELALLPMYGLLRYEKDATLLSLYRQALDAWWQNISREANPLWTFIYLTGHPDSKLDLQPAVHTLYRSPMETITWGTKNSHRRDLVWANTTDRFGHPEVLTLLPPDERPIMRWNANPFVVDSRDNGSGEDDGAAFLLPYWMGRYHQYLVGE